MENGFEGGDPRDNQRAGVSHMVHDIYYFFIVDPTGTWTSLRNKFSLPYLVPAL